MPHGMRGPLIGFLGGMRAVKNRAHAVQCNSNTRAKAFRDFAAERGDHAFDVSPRDIRPDRIFKNALERPSVLSSHGYFNDIML